jgi:hypothetical protein
MWVDDGVGTPAEPPMYVPSGPSIPPMTPVAARSGRRRTGRVVKVRLISAAVGLVIVGGIALYNHEKSAQRSSSGQITRNGNLGVTSLRAGDCFQNTGTAGSTLTSVTAVSCSTPHNAQVYALLPVSGSSYPGTAALNSQGQTGCRSATSADLDRTKLTATMSVVIFYPEQDTWDSGQRAISCVITDSSTDLTASLLKQSS